MIDQSLFANLEPVSLCHLAIGSVCSLGSTYNLQAFIDLIQLLTSASPSLVSSVHAQALSFSQRYVNNKGPLSSFLSIYAAIHAYGLLDNQGYEGIYQGLLWLSHSEISY